MITRERLEELIEQGATIWGVTDYTYHSSKPYKRIEYWDLRNTSPFYKKNIDYFLEMSNYTEFFETKEEAEWELEFGNITRTEILSLPTWEELQKDLEKLPDGEYVIVDNYRITFTYCKPSGFDLICCDYYAYDNYNFGSTKENYIEACKLAKKLFLGEKE